MMNKRCVNSETSFERRVKRGGLRQGVAAAGGPPRSGRFLLIPLGKNFSSFLAHLHGEDRHVILDGTFFRPTNLTTTCLSVRNTV